MADLDFNETQAAIADTEDEQEETAESEASLSELSLEE